MLLNLYTNNAAYVSWNGIQSKNFPVRNGVRQGGIISPVLFCIYIDGLLCMLCESGVGCYIGRAFVGALAYADDIALLAPTPSAMRRLLRICDEYGQKFSVMFNAAKSAWLLVSKSKQPFKCVPEFYIGNQCIDLASEYVHLGHIVSASLDDKHEILSKRNSFVWEDKQCAVLFLET